MNQATATPHSHAASTRTLTGISILTAIVVVLTVLCNFIKFGPFSITLALAPIIIGAALYGRKAGAILGGVFGLVVVITGLLGFDGGTVLFLCSQNALATVLICLVKGTAAGFLAGLTYEALAKKSRLAGVITAGIVCPVVNTGLFILGMLLCFYDVLSSWASGASLIYYLIFGLTGVNFLIELAVNLILSSTLVRIIKVGEKR